MMLRIGIPDTAPANWLAEYVRTELLRAGIEYQPVIVPVATGDQTGGLAALRDALLQGALDAAVFPLDLLPPRRAEGLVVTAVSRRDNPAELLVFRPEALAQGRIFKLKDQALVGTNSAIRRTQLQDIRPDVRLEPIGSDLPGSLDALHRGLLDALCLAAADPARYGLDLNGLETIELNPREFVPAPAQGVTAWLAHRDDLPTRRLLKAIHHPDVSVLTNVERRVWQLLDDQALLPLGVYAERDAAGNFHVCAAYAPDGVLRRARLSQSTRFELGDRVFGQLMG